MRKTVIYECPECGDRKMLDGQLNSPNIAPTLWCNCDGFLKMDVDYMSDNRQQPNVDPSELPD